MPEELRPANMAFTESQALGLVRDLVGQKLPDEKVQDTLLAELLTAQEPTPEQLELFDWDREMLEEIGYYNGPFVGHQQNMRLAALRAREFIEGKIDIQALAQEMSQGHLGTVIDIVEGLTRDDTEKQSSSVVESLFPRGRMASYLEQQAEALRELRERIDKNFAGMYAAAAPAVFQDNPNTVHQMLLSGLLEHPELAPVQFQSGQNKSSIRVSLNRELLSEALQQQSERQKMRNFIDGRVIRQWYSGILRNYEQTLSGISQEDGPDILEAVIRQPITVEVDYRSREIDGGGRLGQWIEGQKKEVRFMGADILNLIEDDWNAYRVIWGQKIDSGLDEGEQGPPAYVLGKIIMHKLGLDPVRNEVEILRTNIPEVLMDDVYVGRDDESIRLSFEEWKELPPDEKKRFRLIQGDQERFSEPKDLMQWLSWQINLAKSVQGFFCRAQELDPQINTAAWPYAWRGIYNLSGYMTKYHIGPSQARRLETLWRPFFSENEMAIPAIRRIVKEELEEMRLREVEQQELGISPEERFIRSAMRWTWFGPILEPAASLYLEDIVLGTDPNIHKKSRAKLIDIDSKYFRSFEGKLEFLQKYQQQKYLRTNAQRWQVAQGLCKYSETFKNAITKRSFETEFRDLGEVGVEIHQESAGLRRRYALIPKDIVPEGFEAKMREGIDYDDGSDSDIEFRRVFERTIKSRVRKNGRMVEVERDCWAVNVVGIGAYRVLAAMGWETFDHRPGAEQNTFYKEARYTLSADESKGWLMQIGGAPILNPQVEMGHWLSLNHRSITSKEEYAEDEKALERGTAQAKGFGYANQDMWHEIYKNILDIYAIYSNVDLPSFDTLPVNSKKGEVTYKLRNITDRNIINMHRSLANPAWQEALALGFSLDPHAKPGHRRAVLFGAREVIARGINNPREEYKGRPIAEEHMLQIIGYLITEGKLTKESLKIFERRYSGIFEGIKHKPH